MAEPSTSPEAFAASSSSLSQQLEQDANQLIWDLLDRLNRDLPVTNLIEWHEMNTFAVHN